MDKCIYIHAYIKSSDYTLITIKTISSCLHNAYIKHTLYLHISYIKKTDYRQIKHDYWQMVIDFWQKATDFPSV